MLREEGIIKLFLCCFQILHPLMIELLKEATADAEEETYFCFYQVQQAD